MTTQRVLLRTQEMPTAHLTFSTCPACIYYSANHDDVRYRQSLHITVHISGGPILATCIAGAVQMRVIAITHNFGVVHDARMERGSSCNS